MLCRIADFEKICCLFIEHQYNLKFLMVSQSSMQLRPDERIKMESLPPEVLIEIFQYLQDRTKLLSKVSAFWRSVLLLEYKSLSTSRILCTESESLYECFVTDGNALDRYILISSLRRDSEISLFSSCLNRLCKENISAELVWHLCNEGRTDVIDEIYKEIPSTIDIKDTDSHWFFFIVFVLYSKRNDLTVAWYEQKLNSESRSISDVISSFCAVATPFTFPPPYVRVYLTPNHFFTILRFCPVDVFCEFYARTKRFIKVNTLDDFDQSFEQLKQLREMLGMNMKRFKRKLFISSINKTNSLERIIHIFDTLNRQLPDRDHRCHWIKNLMTEFILQCWQSERNDVLEHLHYFSMPVMNLNVHLHKESIISHPNQPNFLIALIELVSEFDDQQEKHYFVFNVVLRFTRYDQISWVLDELESNFLPYITDIHFCASHLDGDIFCYFVDRYFKSFKTTFLYGYFKEFLDTHPELKACCLQTICALLNSWNDKNYETFFVNEISHNDEYIPFIKKWNCFLQDYKLPQAKIRQENLIDHLFFPNFKNAILLYKDVENLWFCVETCADIRVLLENNIPFPQDFKQNFRTSLLSVSIECIEWLIKHEFGFFFYDLLSKVMSCDRIDLLCLLPPTQIPDDLSKTSKLLQFEYPSSRVDKIVQQLVKLKQAMI